MTDIERAIQTLEEFAESPVYQADSQIDDQIENNLRDARTRLALINLLLR